MFRREGSKHPWSKYNYITYTLEADPELKRGLQVNFFKKEWFEKTIEMPFENTVLPVPIGYDKILTQEYGDYMTFPPIESRKAKHDMVFEPDIPYKEYPVQRPCHASPSWIQSEEMSCSPHILASIFCHIQ